jgi:hypothetical protein
MQHWRTTIPDTLRLAHRIRRGGTLMVELLRTRVVAWGVPSVVALSHKTEPDKEITLCLNWRH